MSLLMLLLFSHSVILPEGCPADSGPLPPTPSAQANSLQHISKSIFLQLVLLLYLFLNWCSHKTHEVTPRLVCAQLLEPQPFFSSSLQHIKEQAAICCYQTCLFKRLFHEPSQNHQAGFQLHKTTVFEHYENHSCPSSSITFGPWQWMLSSRPGMSYDRKDLGNIFQA